MQTEKKQNKKAGMLSFRAAGLCVLVGLSFVADLGADAHFGLGEAKATVGEWETPAMSLAIAQPLELANESFEYPQIEGTWQYIPAANDASVLSGEAQSYGEGWEVEPPFGAAESTTLRKIIEYRRGGGLIPDGEQYVELNTDGPTGLYRRFASTPGSRIYYSFYHKQRNNDSETMRVYAKAQDASDEQAQILGSHTAQPSWQKIEGLYIVPQEQTMTEFGFRANAGDLSNEGNFIDDVRLRTGAQLLPQKSSDADHAAFVRPGEIFTVRIRIDNAGQTGASHVRISDGVGEGFRYIGNVKVNGQPAQNAIYHAGNHRLELDLGELIIAPTGEEQSYAEISYQVEAEQLPDGLVSRQARSQTRVGYKDFGYENLTENADGFTAYSNVYGLAVIRPIEEGSISVTANFSRTQTENERLPFHIGLFRDDVLFETVELNTENGFTFLHEHLEQEFAEDYEEQIRLATSSDSIASDSVRRHTWSVKALDMQNIYDFFYTSPALNQFVVEAVYKRRDSDSSNGNTSEISDSARAKREIREEKAEPKNKDSQDLEFSYHLADESKLNHEGEPLRYLVQIKNRSETEITGIWIRDFLPRFTQYSSSDELGEYGVINGREHVTWFVEKLLSGESRELYVEVIQDYCHPLDIENEINYTITGDTKKPYVNEINGP